LSRIKEAKVLSQAIHLADLECRNKYGKIYQEEIRPHLNQHSKKLKINTTSIENIGRIIRKLKDKGLLSNVVKYRLNDKSRNLLDE
jgi:hypothetical protein